MSVGELWGLRVGRGHRGIAAVAAAAPNTIVVLETGTALLSPG